MFSGRYKIEKKIERFFSRAGFTLEEEDLQRFSLYLHELIRWNRVHNLTSIKDKEGIIRKHFLDSLSIARCFLDLGIEWKGKDVADIGSGAGFPGVPLKIYLKDIDLYLIESSSKRCSFLEFLKAKLSLDWHVLCRRAESVEKKFHIVVCRALGELEDILPLLEALSSAYIFVMKGKNIKERWLTEFGLRTYRVRLAGIPESYILWKRVK